MAVDPNVYALNVQVQLDSTKAFETLNTIEQAFTNLEARIRTAAESTLQAIQASADSIKLSLDASTASVELMDGYSLAMATNMEKYSVFLDKSSETIEDDLEDLVKTEELWDKIEKHHKEITDYFETESKDMEKYIDMVKDLDKAVQEKNKGHEEENSLVKEEGPLWDSLNEAAERHNDRTRDTVRVLGDAYNGLINIIRAYAQAVKGADEFNNANFRLYGTQMQLFEASVALSAELGISQEAAIEVYKELANARTPRAELDKLARSVALVGKVTGVNTQALISYTKAMRMAGTSAEEQTKRLVMVAEAMRKYGLSAEDAAKSINYTGVELSNLKTMLGGDEELTKYIASMTHMMAIAKDLGDEGVKGIEDFQKMIADPVGMMQLQASTGVLINSAEDVNNAMIKLGKRYAEEQARIEAMPERALKKQALATLNATMDAQAGSVQSGKALMEIYKRAAEKYGEDLSNITEEQLAGLAQLAENQNTLNGQLDKFSRLVNGIVQIVWNDFIAEGLKDILMVVNMLLEPMVEFIQYLREAGYFGKQTSVYFRIFRAVAVMLFLAIAVGIPLIGSLGVAFVSLGTIFGRTAITVTEMFASMSQALLTIARTIGQSIYIVLSYIGRGLAALGRAISPYIGQLFALSVAMLIVAASFYIVAQALMIIKSAGWEAIGMFAVIVVIMALFVGVMVALGVVVQGPIALGVIIVAAALLALGAAAWMVGAAIEMMGKGVFYAGLGIEKIATYLTPMLPVNIMTLAVALTFLAYSAWANVASIARLGKAFKEMGDGATATLGSIQPIIDKLSSLANLDLTASFDNLKNSLLKFQEELEKVDMSKLVKIANDMLSASFTLIIASYAMIGASILLAIAGILFAIGAGLIAISIKALHPASSLLVPTAENLITGAQKMLEAMPALLQVSAGLLAVSMAMIMPAAIFFGVSLALFVGAIMFFNASVLISIGGTLFAAGTIMFKSGAESLRLGSVTLVENSAIIFRAIALIGMMGLGLLATGAVLLAAGMTFMLGSVMIMLGMGTISLVFSTLMSVAASYGGTLDKVAILAQSLASIINGVTSLSVVSATGISDLAGVTAALGIEVDMMTAKLNEYASAFERAAERISDSMNSKVIPALKAAKEAGLSEDVRAETIVATPIYNVSETETVGAEAEGKGESAIASAIADASGKEALLQIFNLLQAYLPALTDKDNRGFTSSLTGW